MALWQPDVILEFTLLPAESGGRASPLPHSDWFGCPLCIGNTCFDVRLDLSEYQGQIRPGISAQVPAKFLCPELALASVKLGVEFTLWEAKTIATGRVVGVTANP
jgi:hypothetical protein